MTQNTADAARIAAALDADQVAQLDDGAIAYRSRNAYGAETVNVDVEDIHLIHGRIDEEAGFYWVVTRRTAKPSFVGARRPIDGRSRVELAIQLAAEIRAAA